MLVPRTPRQAISIRQPALARDQVVIHRCQLCRHRLIAQSWPVSRERLLIMLRAPRHRIDRILKRSKIQMWRHLLLRRSHRRTPRIESRLEYSVFQFLILLPNLVLLRPPAASPDLSCTCPPCRRNPRSRRAALPHPPAASPTFRPSAPARARTQSPCPRNACTSKNRRRSSDRCPVRPRRRYARSSVAMPR